MAAPVDVSPMKTTSVGDPVTSKCTSPPKTTQFPLRDPLTPHLIWMFSDKDIGSLSVPSRTDPLQMESTEPALAVDIANARVSQSAKHRLLSARHTFESKLEQLPPTTKPPQWAELLFPVPKFDSN